MERVLVIAGGKWQVPLLKKLKSMGFEIVCSNLYPDSVGFQYADYCEVADVRDFDRNLEIAQKYQIDAVFTDQSDIAVPTAAYVSEQLGLHTIGSALAELFTNKYRMREYLEQKGFPYPEYKICSHVVEAIQFYLELNSKSIIKPLDSQSSRGIYEICSVKDLETYFEETKKSSKDQKSVLIERYIEGTEFTADGIVLNGIHRTLAISEKSHYDFNQNVADALYFSYKNDRFDYDALRKQNDAIIQSTGLPFGLTHAEYKFENGTFYLIEMAARGGGTKISSDIVPYMTGIDNYALWIQSVLDGNKQMELPTIKDEMKNRYMVLQFLDYPVEEKRIKAINGVKEINELPQIHDFALNINVGDLLKRATDDSNRIGYYIASGESMQDLKDMKDKVMERFSIELE